MRAASNRLWVVKLPSSEWPRWAVAYESIDDSDEIVVLPYRYDDRASAMCALRDARERRRILEEADRVSMKPRLVP